MALRFVTDLGTHAVADGHGSFLRQNFVSEVHWKLNVALCRWNAHIEWTVAGYFAFAAGWAFMHGVAQLTVEVDAWGP
jgi:hypothetical protein